MTKRKPAAPSFTGITEYEVDPRDIEDMLRGKRLRSRPPVRITYYKPTRAQQLSRDWPYHGRRAQARPISRCIRARSR